MTDLSSAPVAAPSRLRGGPAGLLDFVAVHRRAHYGPDDRQLATFIGPPEGAALRSFKQLLVVLAPVTFAMIWIAFGGVTVLESVGLWAVAMVAILGGRALLRRVGRHGDDLLRGVVVTTTHVLLTASGAGNRHRVLAELPPDAITWCEVGVAPGADFTGKRQLLTFGGPTGTVASIEGLGLSLEALDVHLGEAGIARRPSAG